MIGPEVLCASNIVKNFGGVRALKGVDFSLRQGEVHVLVGENGAGKSTLIKILSGVLTPDDGVICLKGTPADLSSPIKAQRLGIYAIHQELALVPHQSIGENIYLGMLPTVGTSTLVDWKQLILQSKKTLEQVGLDVDPRIKVEGLPAAEKQLVSIARALVRKAEILILDEPTASLTIKETSRLFDIIKRLREQGVSICYISHRLEELEHIGNRITVLKDGEVVNTVPPDTPQEDLIRLMTGREARERFPQIEPNTDRVCLSVRGITKRSVFEDISFDLHEGEILGIAGLVGSRRSEVVNAIFGSLNLDSGTVEIHGKPTAIRCPKHALNNGICLLPPERKSQGIVPDMSVSENVTVSSLKRVSRFGVISERLETRISMDFVNKLNIKTPHLKEKIRLLSGGNQQKVVFARALSTSPKIFLLDEPTRGIDVGSKMEIYQLLKNLSSQGAGILLISSELPELIALCHRIIVMRYGKITGEFSKGEVSEEKILNCAFMDQEGAVAYGYNI